MRTTTRDEIEVLAPAGSREALSAAVKAGADAVYFGAGRLNMRSRSSSVFSPEDFKDIAEYAAAHGVRTYLTLNVVLFDEDMDEMRLMVDAAKAAGISAVIACDIAAMEYARSVGMEVHLSTQTNVSNLEALRFYARWADTIVLARELSLEQIAVLCKKIEEQNICGPSGKLVRVEIFAHGALCMAVSGKCYLSLHRYGASANRGACYQNCRRSYILKDAEEGHEILVDGSYYLSPKDLKTIQFMDQILDAGVRTLKIEGRARGPEYVQAAVCCYREAVDAVIDGSFGPALIEDWDKRLAEVFNRGFWDGWYLGAPVGERTSDYGSQARLSRHYVGYCTNYFKKAGAAEFVLQAGTLQQGEEILITGPSTGALRLIPNELRVNDKAVGKADKGEELSFLVPERVRRNDKLYVLKPRF